MMSEHKKGPESDNPHTSSPLNQEPGKRDQAGVMPFWKSTPLEELAEIQGISPADNLDEISSLWPADDNPEDLLQFILTDRAERGR